MENTDMLNTGKRNSAILLGRIANFLLIIMVLLIASYSLFYYGYMKSYYTDDKLQVVALHEAGHAVAYEYFFPDSVYRVSIDTVPPFKYAVIAFISRFIGKKHDYTPSGVTLVNETVVSKEANNKSYYRNLIVCLSVGEVATTLNDKGIDVWLNYGASGSDSDRDKAFAFFVKLAKQQGYISEDATSWQELYRISNSKATVNKEYFEILNEYTNFTTEHAEDIRALSKALLNKHELSGYEVRAIINNN